jgi:hypothetical protein
MRWSALRRVAFSEYETPVFAVEALHHPRSKRRDGGTEPSGITYWREVSALTRTVTSSYCCVCSAASAPVMIVSFSSMAACCAWMTASFALTASSFSPLCFSSAFVALMAASFSLRTMSLDQGPLLRDDSVLPRQGCKQPLHFRVVLRDGHVLLFDGHVLHLDDHVFV